MTPSGLPRVGRWGGVLRWKMISAVWALVPTVDRRGGRKPPDLPRVEPPAARGVGKEGSGLRAVWVQGQLERSLKLGRKERGLDWTQNLRTANVS